jgi:transposase-like protein
MRSEGLGMRARARVIGVAPNSVIKWEQRLSKHKLSSIYPEQFHD